MTNKNFQKAAIAKIMRAYGLDADLVDYEAHIDSTLSIEENARNIREMYNYLPRKANSSIQGTQSVAKVEYYIQAREIFERLPQRRQIADGNRRARNQFSASDLTERNFKKWKKNINHFDIVGVDL